MWSYEEFIGDRHSDEGSTSESADGSGRLPIAGTADEKDDGSHAKGAPGSG